jgi:hypothetical protein
VRVQSAVCIQPSQQSTLGPSKENSPRQSERGTAFFVVFLYVVLGVFFDGQIWSKRRCNSRNHQQPNPPPQCDCLLLLVGRSTSTLMCVEHTTPTFLSQTHTHTPEMGGQTHPPPPSMALHRPPPRHHHHRPTHHALHAFTHGILALCMPYAMKPKQQTPHTPKSPQSLQPRLVLLSFLPHTPLWPWRRRRREAILGKWRKVKSWRAVARSGDERKSERKARNRVCECKEWMCQRKGGFPLLPYPAMRVPDRRFLHCFAAVPFIFHRFVLPAQTVRCRRHRVSVHS